MQVRNLQAELAQKEENLKAANVARSSAEDEIDLLKRHVRHLDENEQRYREENWDLEARTHELMAAAKEAADREQKLSHAVKANATERAAVLAEFDDLKAAHENLTEKHVAFVKHHDAEAANLRKTASHSDRDNDQLRTKVRELIGQNQELARAIAARAALDEAGPSSSADEGDLDADLGMTTPDGSPPPSPTKGTPRHSVLESETLKSSLHHAHRMIQNLKGTIHREKSEKLELRRMLQDARDEVEVRRSEAGLGNTPGNTAKRRKAAQDKDGFKRPPRPNLLGAGRSGTSDVLVVDDDPEWEDHADGTSPTRAAVPRSFDQTSPQPDRVLRSIEDPQDSAAYNSDAFETATEREGTTTENDAFETGAESLDGDSGDDTETEAALHTAGTLRPRPRPGAGMPPPRLTRRDSFASTASTSGDEDDGARNRTAPGPPQQRYRLRVNRSGAFRRSRSGGEAALADSSPGSVKNSPASVVTCSGNAAGGLNNQTLFAELGDLGHDDSDFGGDGEHKDGTPGRSAVASRGTTPASSMPETASKGSSPSAPRTLVPRPIMLDAATMTDVASEEPASPSTPTASPRQVVHHAPEPHSREETPARFIERGDTPTLGLLPVTILQPTTQATDAEPEKSLSGGEAVGSGLPPLDLSPMVSVDIQPVEQIVKLPVASAQAPPSARAKENTTTTAVLPVPDSTAPNSVETLSVSPIVAQAIEPVEAAVRRPTPTDISSGAPPSTDNETVGHLESLKKTEHRKRDASGIIGSVFGWAKSQVAPERTAPASVPAEEHGLRETRQDADNELLAGVDADQRSPGTEPFDLGPRPLRIDLRDHSAQTVLTSDQIDNMMRERHANATAQVAEQDLRMGPPSPKTAAGTPLATRYSVRGQEPHPVLVRARARTTDHGATRDDSTPTKPIKRSGSSGSMRSSSSAHPPLPPDHKQAIAAAAQRVSSSEPTTGLMGPPLAPASAYKRSMPPPPLQLRMSAVQIQSSPGSKAGTTPRARQPPARSEASSAITRRSSVSSFASELDERFNIRTDGAQIAYGLENPATDPRMIQAITQTMIGEYLWKYTRKAGRPDMSDNRHRRFFWVHPYTRTLYWSEKDPASGGRAEVRAKSVGIDAVRVIADDNPMPPGLHRKSLVVKTPGRSLVLTATTRLRHDTWFNALSYLLLRTGTAAGAGAGGVRRAEDLEHDGALTTEDVDEFNPLSRRRSRYGMTSRSSFVSRNTRMTSPARTVSRATSRSRAAGIGPSGTITGPSPSSGAAGASLAPPMLQPEATLTPSTRGASNDPRQGSMSRLSQLFRPPSGLAGTFSSRRSRYSLRTASVRDSASTGATAVAHPGPSSTTNVGNATGTGNGGGIGSGNASGTRDSVDEAREEVERLQREADGLENVRACCDGEFCRRPRFFVLAVSLKLHFLWYLFRPFHLLSISLSMALCLSVCLSLWRKASISSLPCGFIFPLLNTFLGPPSSAHAPLSVQSPIHLSYHNTSPSPSHPFSNTSKQADTTSALSFIATCTAFEARTRKPNHTPTLNAERPNSRTPNAERLNANDQ